MTRVADLVPGQQIVIPIDGAVSTYVAQAQHPIWPGLTLVVWRITGEPGRRHRWSHDALDSRQDVGTPKPSTAEQRLANLRGALLGQWEDG